jgi:hypothetical protein
MNGNGWQIAVGAAYQPSLHTLWGLDRQNDSLVTGGQFSGDQEIEGDDPFAPIHASTIVAGMASYRTKRLTADAAVVAEKVSGDATNQSPLYKFDGVSPRFGAVFRLTPSFGIGGSYWGDGAPPWRDQIRFGLPGEQKQEKFGVLLGFGSSPEAGTDLMITSPTGDITQSVRLYIRLRSTH